MLSYIAVDKCPFQLLCDAIDHCGYEGWIASCVIEEPQQPIADVSAICTHSQQNQALHSYLPINEIEEGDDMAFVTASSP